MDNWIKAGQIAGKTREYAKSLIKENLPLIELTEKTEEYIQKLGANPAFPAQFSINEIAAHYAAQPNDQTILKSGDLVKIDIGVEFEGAIGDTATTVEVKTKKNQKLIEASEKALENALKILKPGLEIYKIGEVIENTIKVYNYNPIRNLSGHGLDKFTIHTGKTIPNYNNQDKTKLKEDQIIAIEPFATPGTGLIKEGKPSTIYRIEQVKPIRDINAKNILNHIVKTYKTLPFSALQISKKFQNYKLALLLLEKNQILHHYPQLPEISNSIVSQAEHTVIIKDKPIITTKI